MLFMDRCLCNGSERVDADGQVEDGFAATEVLRSDQRNRKFFAGR